MHRKGATMHNFNIHVYQNHMPGGHPSHRNDQIARSQSPLGQQSQSSMAVMKQKKFSMAATRNHFPTNFEESFRSIPHETSMTVMRGHAAKLEMDNLRGGTSMQEIKPF